MPCSCFFVLVIIIIAVFILFFCSCSHFCFCPCSYPCFCSCSYFYFLFSRSFLFLFLFLSFLGFCSYFSVFVLALVLTFFVFCIVNTVCIPSKEATEIYPPGERSSVPRSIFPRSMLSNPSWTPLLSWLIISPTLKLKLKSSKML